MESDKIGIEEAEDERESWRERERTEDWGGKNKMDGDLVRRI
jgi:hypothetical protein